MKKVLYLFACVSAGFILHAQEFGDKAGTVLYEGNFDGLPAGAYVAQSHPVWWTTWDNKPGTSEDALVTTEKASSAPHSAKCTKGTDLVFKAGNKTEGVYSIDFDMYIPNGASAYFNILHIFKDPSTEWSIGVFFNPSEPGMPVETCIVLNITHIPFSFPFDKWFPISLFIDLRKMK